MTFWVTTIFLLVAPLLLAGELNREIDLQGEWLFEIGDNLEFADPNFNDSRWVTVNVPEIDPILLENPVSTLRYRRKSPLDQM